MSEPSCLRSNLQKENELSAGHTEKGEGREKGEREGKGEERGEGEEGQKGGEERAGGEAGRERDRGGKGGEEGRGRTDPQPHSKPSNPNQQPKNNHTRTQTANRGRRWPAQVSRRGAITEERTILVSHSLSAKTCSNSRQEPPASCTKAQEGGR